MTQEEKAKAYDEAFEYAHHLINERCKEGTNGSFHCVDLEKMFPELKESEDEKIRKAIIQHFKTTTDAVIGHSICNIPIEKVFAWIEKQGEQNHTDKVKPKFKDGDWVVYKGDICQIVKREEGCNKLVTNYGIEKELVNERNLSTARLWTIQDAKDGNVLCCESGWTCIFRALDNHTNTFSSYCFMDSDKWFCNTGSEGHTLDKAFIKAYNGDIHPATKEQRDLLFQKMKEAGYEWDAEKKELKRIYQNPAWSEEDEDIINKILCICYDFERSFETSPASTKVIKEDVDKIYSWLKSLKYRVQPQLKLKD